MSAKISQDELRKFMKQKRENLTSQKVDSPFAKYSSTDQLSCSICNVAIKSNNLWVPHIVGKIHKENLLKSKKSSNENTSTKIATLGVKRPSEQPDVVKKVRADVFKVPQDPPKLKPAVASSLLAGYSSSSSDESDDNNEEESKTNTPAPDSTNNSLPPDFFDSSKTNGVSSESSSNVTPDTKVSTTSTSSAVEPLPEGFFDDPVLDAKARNIEYKDPVEEEWERFQKSMAEETNLSKTIIAEDLVESTLERDIVQIDEQIQQWERIKDLETLADTVKMKVAITDGDMNDSSSTDDDLNEDDLLDWRSKSIKKM